MAWPKESRRHGLARKGIPTVIDQGRRFDMSNFVARGTFSNWITMGQFLEYLDISPINIIGYDEHGILLQNQESEISDIAHLDVYDGMKYNNDNYKWEIDWDRSPEVKTDDVKDALAIITEDWIKEFKILETSGKPRVTVYDNGGKTMDRYTVIIGESVYGMSHNPLQPNGVNQYAGERDEFPKDLSHLGKKIEFENLTPEVMKAVEDRIRSD